MKQKTVVDHSHRSFAFVFVYKPQSHFSNNDIRSWIIYMITIGETEFSLFSDLDILSLKWKLKSLHFKDKNHL